MPKAPVPIEGRTDVLPWYRLVGASVDLIGSGPSGREAMGFGRCVVGERQLPPSRAFGPYDFFFYFWVLIALWTGKAGENGQKRVSVSIRRTWLRPSATSGRKPFGSCKGVRLWITYTHKLFTLVLFCCEIKLLWNSLLNFGVSWSLLTGSPAGRPIGMAQCTVRPW